MCMSACSELKLKLHVNCNIAIILPVLYCTSFLSYCLYMGHGIEKISAYILTILPY